MSYSLCGKCGDMVPDCIVAEHECNTSSRQYRISTLKSENARLRAALHDLLADVRNLASSSVTRRLSVAQAAEILEPPDETEAGQ